MECNTAGACRVILVAGVRCPFLALADQGTLVFRRSASEVIGGTGFFASNFMQDNIVIRTFLQGGPIMWPLL
jgi:hypothetical protein